MIEVFAVVYSATILLIALAILSGGVVVDLAPFGPVVVPSGILLVHLVNGSCIQHAQRGKLRVGNTVPSLEHDIDLTGRGIEPHALILAECGRCPHRAGEAIGLFGHCNIVQQVV